MMQLRHGIFDEATLSVIASETVREIGRLSGLNLDVRRFRPNVVVRLLRSVPFKEVVAHGDGDVEGQDLVAVPGLSGFFQAGDGVEGDVIQLVDGGAHDIPLVTSAWSLNWSAT
jgi:hypothetical protein